MFETQDAFVIVFLGGAFLIGVVIGRWWALLLLTALVVLWASYEFPVETEGPPPHYEIGLYLGAFFAAFMAWGTGIRKLIARDRESRKTTA